MSDLLVKNVVLNGENVSIYCRDGKIVNIGNEVDTAAKILDGNGKVAFPSLINAHTHSAMTLFRGNGDDLPLMEWLQKRVWPYEEKITKDEIYWGTRLAIIEMIRNGITLFNDMYWDFHVAAKAVEETGIRACISSVFIDLGDKEKAARQRKFNEKLYEESKQYSELVQFAVGPHAIYTVSEESLRWAADFTREHNIPLHIHLSETDHEVTDSIKANGLRPVQYLNKLGAVSNRLSAAHTVHLDEEDIRLLGENNVMCVHNPVSNMKLAVNGVYPYRKLKEAGAVTALGTDGAGSNNSLDLFEDMKIAALLQKLHDNDPTALPATEAWDMTTRNPAAFFGLQGGELCVGREADFILINNGAADMNPPHDLISHLVYAANGFVVDSVVCNGKVLMEHRNIEGEEEVIAKANEAARSMFARIDEA